MFYLFWRSHPQYAANKCQEVNHKTITAVVRVTNQTHLHLNQWNSQHNSYSSWKNLEKSNSQSAAAVMHTGQKHCHTGAGEQFPLL